MKKLIVSLTLGLITIASFSLAAPSYADDYNYFNYPEANQQFHPQHPDYYDGNKRLELKKRADYEMASAPNLHYDKYNNDYYWCNWNYNSNLGTWVCEKSDTKPSQDPVIQKKGSTTSNTSAQNVTVCLFGYQYSSVGGGCAKIPVPANAHLSSNGTGWECNSGYKPNDYHTACVTGYSSSSFIYSTASASESVENNVEHTTEYVDDVAVTKYVYFYDEEGEPAPVTPRPGGLPSTGPALSLMLFGSVVGSIGIVRRKKQ